MSDAPDFTVEVDPPQRPEEKPHAPPRSEKPVQGKVVALDFDQFLNARFPTRAMMLTPWLSTSAIAMIHAARGTGKTYIAHGAGIAVATGGNSFAGPLCGPTACF